MTTCYLLQDWFELHLFFHADKNTMLGNESGYCGKTIYVNEVIPLKSNGIAQ